MNWLMLFVCAIIGTAIVWTVNEIVVLLAAA